MTKKEATVVCIKPIVKKTAKIRIICDSPLIVPHAQNNFLGRKDVFYVYAILY